MSNRRVLQMLKGQAEDLAFKVMSQGITENGLEAVERDEVSIELFKKKGHMDIRLSCRCFDGKLLVYRNGDIVLYNSEDEIQEIYGQHSIAEWIKWTWKLHHVR